MRLSSSCRYVIDAGVTLEAAVETAGAELVAGTPLNEDEVVGTAELEVREKDGTVDAVVEAATTEVVLGVIDGIDGAVLDDSDNPVEGALVAVLVDSENVKGPLDAVVLEELAAGVTAGNRLVDVLVLLAAGNENPLVAAEVVVAEVVAAAVVDVLDPNESPVEDGADVVAGVARLKVNPDDVEAGVEPKENPVEETGAADVTAVVLVAAGVAPKLKPVDADVTGVGAVDPKLNPVEGAAGVEVGATGVDVGAAGDEKRPVEAETVGVWDPNPNSPVVAEVATGAGVAAPKANPVDGGAAKDVLVAGVVPRPREGVAEDPKNPL